MGGFPDLGNKFVFVPNWDYLCRKFTPNFPRVCMDNRTVLSRLSGSAPPSRRVLVENQTVADIIDGIKEKHAERRADYDAIAPLFAGGDIYDICERLWKYCKKNFRYDIEGIDEQFVSAPSTMIKRGHNDCKGYALFIAGVLDALKRQGEDLSFVYRFASYKLFNREPGHVFVVVNPKTDNIWIDPVLDEFDQHYPYMYHRDMKISSGPSAAKAVAGICCMGEMASDYYQAQSGAVWAVNDATFPNGLTPDQMGLPYAMQLLARGYDKKHPGTADAWWANPPVTFWLNDQQVGLPPPNTKVGGPVPQLPVGLTVVYASSFMGVPIPPGMPKPFVVAGGLSGYQNKLRLSPIDIPGYPGSATNAQLSANDSLLLIILEAAVGPLINSFSAFPYASNFSSSNSIDDKMYNHRNADDLLQPSVSKTVLQTVAPIAETILTYAIPGVGAELSNIAKTLVPKTAVVGPQIVNASAPPIMGPSGGISATTLALLAAAAALLFIFNTD